MGALRIARIVLLSSILVAGCTGNLAALLINLRSVRKNRLGNLIYLHLGLVDFLICSFYTGTVLVMESLDYINYYNSGGDLDQRGPLLRFLFEEINVRLLFGLLFLSSATLTLIAGFRSWKIFNPFGRPSKYIFIGYLILSDVAVVLLVTFLKWPNTRLSLATCVEGSGRNNVTEVDFIANVSTEGNLTVDQMGTFFGLENDAKDNSSMPDCDSGSLQAPMSSKPTLILTLSIGASIFLTAGFYILSCIKLRYEFVKSNFGASSRRQEFLRRQVKHVVTHVILMAAMLITMMPGFLFAIIVNEAGTELLRFMVTLNLVSSVLNPYVYCLLLPSNRGDIRTIWCCGRGSKGSS